MLGGGERRVKPAVFNCGNMTDAILAGRDWEGFLHRDETIVSEERLAHIPFLPGFLSKVMRTI